jgi:Ca-activated chloride channel family protein
MILLTDYGSPQDAPEPIARVTALGLQYHLLTPYTSFIAVHEVVRNPLGAGDNAAQPSPLPLGVTDLAVGEPVRNGSEPELLWIAAALALAVAARYLARGRRTMAGALVQS